MRQGPWASKIFMAAAVAITLSGCGEPRAVLLPLEYPDGSPVTSRNGTPLMAGYQTYGSAMHANATALYETAHPTTCIGCAQVGMVVTEPSVVRQVTGIVGTGAEGAGSVMTGIGFMKNQQQPTNIVQNTTSVDPQNRSWHDDYRRFDRDDD